MSLWDWVGLVFMLLGVITFIEDEMGTAFLCFLAAMCMVTA